MARPSSSYSCKLEKTIRLYERSKMYRNEEVSRVLARSGARLITEDEMNQVPGGFQTNPCTINRTTCNADGDCVIQPGCPPA
jgi:hypothetical protein